MFSRRDIEKELGKGIAFYPFNPKNIKENSINFSVGEYAWSLGSGSVVKNNQNRFKLAQSNDRSKHHIKKGGNAIIQNGNRPTLILLPHVTTIVETKEVIGLGNYIGGTIHSKVGVVAHGVGHISTMMGPCFCGHLMIAVHNVTDDVISIPVGETFISLVFHYLDTPSRIHKNSNMSGHVDKLAELGINIDSETREELIDAWKQDFDQISDKMAESSDYKNYKKQMLRNRFKDIKRYLNWHNVLLTVILFVIAVAMAKVAGSVDAELGVSVWTERYWDVLFAAIVIPIVGSILKLYRQG